MKPLNDQQQLLNLIGRVKESGGAVVTNFFMDPEKVSGWLSQRALSYLESDEGLLLFRRGPGFLHLYYFAADLARLRSLLDRAPAGQALVVDLIDREAGVAAAAEVLEARGFRLHRVLQRYTRINRPGNDFYQKDAAVSYALPEDGPRIARQLRENFDALSEQIPTEEEIGELIGEHRILVAREDGRINGFLIRTITGKHTILNNFFVETASRGKGIGSKLLKHYVAEAKDSTRMVLWVVSDNDRAKEIYQQHGYAKDTIVDHIYTRKHSDS